MMMMRVESLMGSRRFSCYLVCGGYCLFARIEMAMVGVCLIMFSTNEIWNCSCHVLSCSRTFNHNFVTRVHFREQRYFFPCIYYLVRCTAE